MKTLDEIYSEVMASDELKAKFAAVKSKDELLTLVKELDGDYSDEELTAFFKEKQESVSGTEELSEEDLKQVAGGKGYNGDECFWSCATAGIACVIQVLDSLINGDVGPGISDEYDNLLCVTDEGDHL